MMDYGLGLAERSPGAAWHLLSGRIGRVGKVPASAIMEVSGI